MRHDDIVTCRFCREEIMFRDNYVTLNGQRPDTFECRNEITCQRRMIQRGYSEPITLAYDVWM